MLDDTAELEELGAAVLACIIRVRAGGGVQAVLQRMPGTFANDLAHLSKAIEATTHWSATVATMAEELAAPLKN